MRIGDYLIEPGANLKHANLSGVNLHGANLSGADLSGADDNSPTLDELAEEWGYDDWSSFSDSVE